MTCSLSVRYQSGNHQMMCSFGDFALVSYTKGTRNLVITPLISYTKGTRYLAIIPLVFYTKGTREG
jgi:hypothetical protein